MEDFKLTANRTYKASLFYAIFSDRKRLLELYNGVNGSHYTKEEDLELRTLEGALYMKMKNDVSFIFQSELCHYEHQSTVNPNMPLRDLFYVSDLLRGLVAEDDLYRSKRLSIPLPRFIVFYNGLDEQKDRISYKLSELYQIPSDAPDLELVVTVLNINAGHNQELLQSCRTLSDYASLVKRIRDGVTKGLELRQAISEAVDSCINDGILREYLIKNRAEAISMSWWDYNEELHLKNVRDDAHEEALEKHLVDLICIKLRKGKNVEQIADEVEEDINRVKPIFEAALKYAPEYDEKKVLEELKTLERVRA